MLRAPGRQSTYILMSRSAASYLGHTFICEQYPRLQPYSIPLTHARHLAPFCLLVELINSNLLFRIFVKLMNRSISSLEVAVSLRDEGKREWRRLIARRVSVCSSPALASVMQSQTPAPTKFVNNRFDIGLCFA